MTQGSRSRALGVRYSASGGEGVCFFILGSGGPRMLVCRSFNDE